MKKFNKRKGKPRRPPFQPKAITQTKSNIPAKGKAKITKRNPKKQRKPIVCYKCGKAGHKSYNVK